MIRTVNRSKFGDDDEFYRVDYKLAEKRLSLLYNTLWKAGWVYPSAMSGNLTAALDHDYYNGPYPAYGNLLTTKSTTTSLLAPIYAIHTTWYIVNFVSVAIMFLAAATSLVLQTQCHAPQILGHVSSLVRDSTYFNELAQGNSSEAGAERTKRLGGVKFMVADVKGDEAVGRIAFASGKAGSRVRKSRWYE